MAKETVQHFENALTLFEERDWENAAEIFQNVLACNPNDGPSRIYQKRCETFKTKSPPENWDGIYNLEVK